MTRRIGFTVLFLIVTFGMQGRERAVLQPKGPAPLDERTLRGVTLEFGLVEVQPGDRRTLRLQQWQCCVWAMSIPADIHFSMDAFDFATIDPDNGYLTIAPNAPARTSFRVYADIEHGRRIVSADVWIDTPKSNPLLGNWRQVSDSCSFVTPGHQIELLTFRGNGSFSVTWVPFEVYNDYWGFYTFDRPAGHLSLGIRSGNYVPPAFAGDGQYAITEKDGVRTLTMRNIYFGPRYDEAIRPVTPLTCVTTFDAYH
ncbi:MAG TPA: hypothetical protein VJ901_12890 [Thermoanaerobaculia bacterium]|nr:hypothetical protein [Thermoanaerobaculia bacterium]